MEIKVLQENLVKAISTTAKFTSTKPQLPVLGNICLTVKKNNLSVSATNLETSITYKVGAQVEKEGKISIPAKILNDLVSNLNKGSIQLTSKGEKMTISSSDFNSTISGMNASEFPKIQTNRSKNSVTLDGEMFSDGLKKTLFAVSTDETRPILTGLLVMFEKKQLTLVATDGFRLSRKTIVLDKSVVKNTVIIPKGVLSEIPKIMSGPFSFDYDKENSQVVFIQKDIVLTSRIMQGEFPDYDKIIPSNTKIKVELDKDDLLRSIKLASVFARDSSNVVKFLLGKDNLKVSAESSSGGSQVGKTAARVTGYTKNFEIAFNYRYLEDFLNNIKGESVTFKFSDGSSPGVFLDPDDKDYLHIIMPVKIQD